MKNIFFLLAVCFTFTSCATQTNLFSDDYNQVLKSKGTHGFWIGGIGQTKTEILDQVCGEGYKPAKTQTQWTFTNILVSALTLGIYYPREYRIYCAKEG